MNDNRLMVCLLGLSILLMLSGGCGDDKEVLSPEIPINNESSSDNLILGVWTYANAGNTYVSSGKMIFNEDGSGSYESYISLRHEGINEDDQLVYWYTEETSMAAFHYSVLSDVNLEIRYTVEGEERSEIYEYEIRYNEWTDEYSLKVVYVGDWKEENLITVFNGSRKGDG